MEIVVRDVQQMQKFWMEQYKKMCITVAKQLGYETVYIGAGGLYGIKNGVTELIEESV